MSSLGVLEGRGRPRVDAVEEVRREEMVEAKAREEDEVSPVDILALRGL
jgi:hypothetical protein